MVETFIGLLEERTITFRHADDADFEKELNLEARVRLTRGAATRSRRRRLFDPDRRREGRYLVQNDNERLMRRSCRKVLWCC